jgi:3-dehydroquinate dehydratase/shikimate dehydrogenase
MICVTIGRGRHTSLAEEWRAAAQAGADLVELRIDCLRRDPDMKRILKNRPTAMVFTVRRGVDGGLWRGHEDRREQLLREAIVMGAEFVDLEMDIAANIRRFGKTKRIISYHNYTETPENLPDIIEECGRLDADVVKVATNGKTIADSVRLLRVGAKACAKVPTATIAMGELGFFTRILGRKYGAPVTYAGFHPERTFAPGMPRFQTLKRDYFYDQINSRTEIFAVIGDPIEQSLSPAIHNAAFRSLSLNKVMVPFLIPANTLLPSLKELEFLKIKGMSVTIPHKQAILPLLTEQDESVESTGACNTVVFDEDGKISGYNTDYQAALDALDHALGRHPGGPTPLLDRQALILGAGGAARAIAFGLARSGASVTITNRHDDRATALAEEVGCRTVPWGMRAANSIADVIINCTPVGMHPQVDDTPLPPAAFSKPETVVFDTVYHPENTMMLKLAAERGCTVVTGVEMFVRQAAHQFTMYTGEPAPMGLMRDVLKRKLGPFRE